MGKTLDKDALALRLGRKLLHERVGATRAGRLALDLREALYCSLETDNHGTRYLSLRVRGPEGKDPDWLLHEVAAYLEEVAFEEIDRVES